MRSSATALGTACISEGKGNGHKLCGCSGKTVDARQIVADDGLQVTVAQPASRLKLCRSTQDFYSTILGCLSLLQPPLLP